MQVGGGFLPEAVRGTVISGLMTGWDWFATWAHLAGVDDITDRKAALAHLPQPDSINMWPMLSGASSSSPRSQVVVGSNIVSCTHHVLLTVLASICGAGSEWCVCH